MKRLVYLLASGLIIISLFLTSCNSSSIPEVTKILVATDASLPPFESVNQQTNTIEGFDIDIIKAIAVRQNLEIELVDVSWDPLLTGISKGKYEAAISAITITDERKADMLFSDPYFPAGQIIVVQKNNTTIKGKDTLTGDVAVLGGTTGDKEVKKIKSVDVKTYEDIDLAFKDLMEGKVDAVVYDNPFALVYVGKNPAKLKTAGDVFTDEQYGIAVARDKKDLVKTINSGLKTIKDEGLIDEYSRKWLK
ncbi:MAG: basic amino acid ABC transporter substrate-binding protein [Dehalococcoidales bacterium]|nr:basic amino acid ABC transporter substrate-binding protein [Dehalococcoidales bacterium]